ncbi:MAG: hypothetical protein ACT4NX_03845 [Deltaproteobacteria bacterium]
MSDFTITEIRRQGGGFLKSINAELYQNLAGLSAETALAHIYRDYPLFGEPDYFIEFRDSESAVKSDAAIRRLILDFLARAYLGSKTAAVSDKINAAESLENLTLNRRTLAYRSAPAEIKREPKSRKREEIDAQRSAAVLKFTPHYADLFNASQSAAERLGYANLAALADETRSLNLEGLITEAARFLGDTEYVYRDLLGWFFLRRMEIKPRDVKRRDLDFLLNSFELRDNFSASDLPKLAKALFAETGIHIGANIKPDTTARKGKISEPFIALLDPPRSVALSIYPAGGIDDYDSYFRSMGASLVYAGGDTQDAFEFRWLRDAALVELFSALFANLVHEPRWITRYLRADVDRDFFQFLCLRRLARLRLAAGEAIYEHTLYGDRDFYEKVDFYKETLKNATLAEHCQEDYLAPVARCFHSATRFRAEIGVFAASAALVNRYDEQWWRAGDAAGNFLRELWREGGRLTFSDALSRFGFEGFDSAHALRFFERAFP